MNKDSIKLLFVQEAVYLQHEGGLYSSRIRYQTYWTRFLEHFDDVSVLARVKKVDVLPKGYDQSDGFRVNFIALDYYNGYKDFLRKRGRIKQAVKKAVDNHSAFVLRIPGLIGTLVYDELKRRDLKYSVEVVGDPFEVGKFLPLKFPLKIVFQYWALYKMRKIVKDSFAALYVTKSVLQKRYPVNAEAFEASASNVIIPEGMLLSNADIDMRKQRISTISKRLRNFNTPPIEIGVVGMLYALKSPLEIVGTIRILIEDGFNVKVSFAGDGPLLQNINVLSSKFNIESRVICLGSLSSGAGVFKFLDSIDLYIQFSKTEGMPRAMIESMARGCPIIASRVGGISELISEDLLVKPRDIKELAQKIKWLLTHAERMKRAVDDNIRIAKEHTEQELGIVRGRFYSQVYQVYYTH